MSQKSGMQGKLVLIPETEWNTTPGTPTGLGHVIPFESETLKYTRTREKDPTITSGRDYSRPANGPVNVAGDVRVRIDPNAHSWLFRELLGAPVTTAGTNMYTHVFKSNGTPPVGCHLEREIDGEYFLYTGNRASKASFEIGGTGLFAGTFSFIGADEILSSTPVDSTPVVDQHLAFDLGSPDIVIIESGGATTAKLVNITFNVDNETQASEPAIGGAGVTSGVTHGKCAVTGTIRAIYQDSDLYKRARESDVSGLAFSVQHGSGDGTAGNEKITITIPNLLYNADATTIDTPRGLYVEQGFEAYFDSSDAAFQVTLLNTIASLA